MEKLRDKLKGLEKYIDENLANWKNPGAAVAVIKGGEILYLKGHGFKNIKENKMVTPDTVFAIGSVTKSFTSLAAAILVDEEKLSWDTPIINYMPWFKMYDNVATERLTVRDMLCHRSGLPRHELMWVNSAFSRRELVDKIRYLQPSKDFRSTWQYQNQMYAAVGLLIEEITGKTWEEFVYEKILIPLGMNHSQLSVIDGKKANDYALPYNDTNGNIKELPFNKMEAIRPAGSLYLSISDMAIWLNFFLNKGKIGDKQIVSENNFNEMLTAQIPCRLVPWEFSEIKTAGYGLGWFIDIYRGRTQYYHGGSDEGFGSNVTFMPEENIGIAVLTNFGGSMLGTALAYDIYDRLFEQHCRDWGKVLKSEVDKFREMGTDSLTKIAVPMYEGTKPSHKLDAYVGIYENKGYGILTVTKQQGDLYCVYNKVESKLTHYHYDTFIFNYQNEANFTATFGTSNEGKISTITLPFGMDPSVDDIMFNKKE